MRDFDDPSRNTIQMPFKGFLGDFAELSSGPFLLHPFWGGLLSGKVSRLTGTLRPWPPQSISSLACLRSAAAAKEAYTPNAHSKNLELLGSDSSRFLVMMGESTDHMI